MTVKQNQLGRRKFLKLSGGITFMISAGLGFQMCSPAREEDLPNVAINAWVQINPDNSVIIYNPAVEMGQGSMTALPAIVAEEMDADWSKVKIEHSPIDAAIYGHDGWGYRQMMAVVGSYAVEGHYQNLRIAGAQVKQSLIKMAADIWGVSTAGIFTKSGYVYQKTLERKLSYGQIAAKGQLPEEIKEIGPQDFKAPEDYSIIGNYIERRDIPEKVNGTALYAMDVSVPDMVYGVIERAPAYGSAPALLNKDEIESLPGVIKTVPLEYGIGVLAEKLEQALAAKSKLRIDWNHRSDKYDSEREMANYANVIDSNTHAIKTVYETGNVNQKVHSFYTADFYNDYTYHAQMEPLNATVSFSQEEQTAEIWIGTQSPDSTLRVVAKTLEIEEENVTVHRCYLGGGFGRRAKSDYTIEACLLAKASDRPVKLLWTREDDLKSGMFRAASLQRLRAGVNKNGEIITWEYMCTGPGKVLLHTGARPYYQFANQKIEAKYLEHDGVRTSSWRAESHGHNKYAIEAFIAELASQQQTDPLLYRQRLLKDDPRGLSVLNEVASLCNWGSEVPKGRARGLSFCERSAITACVVEISVDESRGKIKVHQVWFAMDAGLIVQPDNALAQVEGGIMMGISSCLLEKVTFKDSAVQQSNFHDYSLLRCSDAPENIQVSMIPSTEKPVGVGEASTPAIGGAIANAFAALTGKRLYHMPFTAERVRELLKG